MTNGFDKLYRMFPRVKRARDFHLYDFNGRRYLDMFADGGRAFLGHKAGRTVLEMKSNLEKGLSAAYPSVYPARLLRQVRAVYPEVSALSVCYAGRGGEFPVFRPFSGGSLPAGVFELLLPMAGSSVVRLFCSAGSEAELPQADPVPPFILAGLCRAASELAAFDGAAAEKAWAAFDGPLWRREGPWLYSELPAEAHAGLFRRLLAAGILISPDSNIPSCAPYFFTEGEIAPIKKIAGDFS